MAWIRSSFSIRDPCDQQELCVNNVLDRDCYRTFDVGVA